MGATHREGHVKAPSWILPPFFFFFFVGNLQGKKALTPHQKLVSGPDLGHHSQGTETLPKGPTGFDPATKTQGGEGGGEDKKQKRRKCGCSPDGYHTSHPFVEIQTWVLSQGPPTQPLPHRRATRKRDHHVRYRVPPRVEGPRIRGSTQHPKVWYKPCGSTRW